MYLLFIIRAFQKCDDLVYMLHLLLLLFILIYQILDPAFKTAFQEYQINVIFILKHFLNFK